MAEMDRVGFSEDADGICRSSLSLSGGLCCLEFYIQDCLTDFYLHAVKHLSVLFVQTAAGRWDVISL